MHCREATKPAFTSIVTGTTMLFLPAFAMLTFTTPHAQATPALAKGLPCNTCHTGSPPSKSNVKK